MKLNTIENQRIINNDLDLLSKLILEIRKYYKDNKKDFIPEELVLENEFLFKLLFVYNKLSNISSFSKGYYEEVTTNPILLKKEDEFKEYLEVKNAPNSEYADLLKTAESLLNDLTSKSFTQITNYITL